MRRIVLSYSNPAKAKKYRSALASCVPGGATLVDADSNSVDAADAGELLATADGLLLTGGPDVVPERYGETLDPAAGVESIPRRDDLEWALPQQECRGNRTWNVWQEYKAANRQRP